MTVSDLVTSFEFPSVDDTVLFPRNGIGSKLLDREKLVSRAVQSIRDHRVSHFFRGPAGSGKTVFLQLLGRKLKEYGDVYWIGNASDLNNVGSDNMFKEMAARAALQKRDVFLLIDEVHVNPNSGRWTYLLKNHASNFITIGVGISQCAGVSVAFAMKFPSAVNESDDGCTMMMPAEMDDEIKYWCDQGSDISPESVGIICKWVHHYTGGHFFPMFKLMEHAFSAADGPFTKGARSTDGLIHVKETDVWQYFCSEDFSRSVTYVDIMNRCFTSLPLSLHQAATRMFAGSLSEADIVLFDKVGFWSSNRNSFFSDLLTSCLFNKTAGLSLRQTKLVAFTIGNVKVYPPFQIDDFGTTMNINSLDYVIAVGLRFMDIDDFLEPTNMNSKYENSLGFSWATRIKMAISNVYMSFQTQVIPDRKTRGANPQVDMFFNGRLNTHVELSRNATSAVLTSKFDRFAKERVVDCKEYDVGSPGPYSQWENYAIVNFVVSDKRKVVMPSNTKYNDDVYTDKLYTFIKSTNTLYRGKNVISTNVVALLPSRPHRNK
jgi:hypothetical protein